MPRWIKLAFCSKQVSLWHLFQGFCEHHFLRFRRKKDTFSFSHEGITNVAHCCLEARTKSATLLRWSRKILTMKKPDSLSLIMRQSVSLSQSYGMPRAKTGPSSERTACWVLCGKRWGFFFAQSSNQNSRIHPSWRREGEEKSKKLILKETC